MCCSNRPGRTHRLCQTAPALDQNSTSPMGRRDRTSYRRALWPDEAVRTRELQRQYPSADETFSLPCRNRVVEGDTIRWTADTRSSETLESSSMAILHRSRRGSKASRRNPTPPRTWSRSGWYVSGVRRVLRNRARWFARRCRTSSQGDVSGCPGRMRKSAPGWSRWRSTKP